MELSITQLLVAVVWIHFVADFILQSNYVAINKARYTSQLLKHAVLYTIPFLMLGIKYALINGILHFIVDYFSSSITSYFYARDRRHAFFVTIGCDQAIHMTCLILTMGYISLWF